MSPRPCVARLTLLALLAISFLPGTFLASTLSAQTPLHATVTAAAAATASAGAGSAARTGSSRKSPRRTRHNRADKSVDEESEDITDSARALDPWTWQVEIGWSLQSNGDATQTMHEVALPQALLRLGVTPRFELRLSADGFLSDSTSAIGTARVSGGSDLELACKYVILPEVKGRFGLGVIPGLSLPVGSGAFTSGGYDPAVTMVWDHSLWRGYDASGNVAVASVSDRGARFTQALVTLSLGHDLPGGWSGFADLGAFSALARDGGRAWLADAGVQHHLGRNVQFDVSLGRGLNAAAPDWFVGAGLAVRAPHHRRPPA